MNSASDNKAELVYCENFWLPERKVRQVLQLSRLSSEDQLQVVFGNRLHLDTNTQWLYADHEHIWYGYILSYN